MTYPSTLLISAARQLERVFEPDQALASDKDELIRQITRMVHQLLRTNLNQLLHILYRVDVEEHQVKRAMLSASQEEVAENIARLIVERELLKAQIRFRYSYN